MFFFMEDKPKLKLSANFDIEYYRIFLYNHREFFKKLKELGN